MIEKIVHEGFDSLMHKAAGVPTPPHHPTWEHMTWIWFFLSVALSVLNECMQTLPGLSRQARITCLSAPSCFPSTCLLLPLYLPATFIDFLFTSGQETQDQVQGKRKEEVMGVSSQKSRSRSRKQETAEVNYSEERWGVMIVRMKTEDTAHRFKQESERVGSGTETGERAGEGISCSQAWSWQGLWWAGNPVQL